MKTFRQYVLLKEEGDYCEGVSLNVDFFWDTNKDVSFLTTGNNKDEKGVLRQHLLRAVIAGKMTVFDKRMTQYGKDPNFGFTYLVVLGQSHIMIHTWPEKHMMNLDVFTCGTEGDPHAIVAYLKQATNPDRVQTHQARRGVRADPKDANDHIDTPEQINTHPPTK